MNGNVELRRALRAANLTLSVRAEAIERDPPMLIDGFCLRLHTAQGESLDHVRSIAVDESLHDGFGLTQSGRRAVKASDWDEAQAQAGKYDAVALFGSHIFDAWRWTMSPSGYYPDLAPGRPYESYNAYRHRMQIDGGYIKALDIIHLVGPDVYESLERAVRADAMQEMGSFGQLGIERRADDIQAMCIIDPVHLVDDAMAAATRSVELLTVHDVDGELLACPYCRRRFERHDLAIVTHRQNAGQHWGVAWGCKDCTGDRSNAITLERMPDIESAMRWTLHMLRKSHMLHPMAVAGWIASLEGIFGEKLRLWREVTL